MASQKKEQNIPLCSSLYTIARFIVGSINDIRQQGISNKWRRRALRDERENTHSKWSNTRCIRSNDDRDIGAGSSGVRGWIGTDLIDLQGSGRRGQTRQLVNTSARISRSIDEQGTRGVRSGRRGNDDIPWRKARYPFSSRCGETPAGPPTTRAGGHRRSWNRAFEKLCVPLGN